MRRLLSFLFFLLFPALLHGQSTTVSGTVTDTGSQTWSSGTYNFQFTPNPAFPGRYTWSGGTLPQNIGGFLSATGTYSDSIPSNSAITPRGSTWTVTFCPLATSECYTIQNITVTGGVQTLNATPPAIQISLINQRESVMRAYSDSEIISAVVASQYYNLTNQIFRVCQAVSGKTCTSWANNGASPVFVSSVPPSCTPGVSLLVQLSGSPNTVYYCGPAGTYIAFGTGVPYPGSGIPKSTGLAWSTSYGAQGTDSNLLTSGTVSGSSVLLCTDANGGATTSGCPSGNGLSGMTVGQIPLAATPSTVTSSVAIQGTDSKLLSSGTVSGSSVFLCTDANGGATTAGCPASGAAPAGNVGDVQSKLNSSTLQASHINDNGSVIAISEDSSFNGPNPYKSVDQYGARAVNNNTVPAIPGITANCTSTLSSIALSSASTFQNGDGVTVYGCGPTNPVSTPSAPTVTPVGARGLTGTGLDVASQTGSTSYQYCVAAVHLGAVTACSSYTTISNGLASLGPQTVANTSISVNNNVFTFVSSAPQTMAVNMMFEVTGAVPSQFNGTYVVATWADSQHWTANSINDTRSGFSTAATTPGSTNWVVSNRIVASTATGSVDQTTYYAVYGGAGSATALIGLTRPQWSVMAGDATYLVVEDYGTTYSATSTLPWYIPTTAPGSATNELLSTTISSGAGTTTLTLAAPAQQTISGQTILFDDGPALVAAATAAGTAYSPLRISIPSTSPSSNYYIINSPTTLPARSEFDYIGSILLNDTLKIPSLVLNGLHKPFGSSAAFQLNSTPVLLVGRAFPGLYILGSGSNITSRNVTIQGLKTNGDLMVLQDGGGGNSLKETQFTLGGNGYTSMAAEFRSDHNGVNTAPSPDRFTDTILTGAQIGTGSMKTPGIFSNNGTSLMFDSIYMSGKGILLRPPTPGTYVQVDKFSYSQGNYIPFYAFVNVDGGSINSSIAVNNLGQDTTFAPIAANLGGIALHVVLNGASGTTSQSLVQGVPTVDVHATGSSGKLRLPTTSSESTVLNSSVQDGTFGASIGLKTINASVALGAPYSLFVRGTAPAAPTSCSASSGSGPTPATYPISYAPVWPNGSEGEASATCSITSTAGNQTLNFTLTAIPGAIGYDVYANGARMYCPVPGTTSLINSFSGSLCGNSQPQNSAGGPVGMQASKLWAPDLVLTSAMVPTGAASLTHLYMDPTANWPAFKPNGNTAYILPGFSGAWAAGQCAVATATTNVFALTVCSTPAFNNITTGSNSTATMTVASGATLTYSTGGVVNASEVIGIDYSAASGCDATTYLRGDGTCNTPAGAGNVSTTTGAQYGTAVWTGSTTLGTAGPGTTKYPLVSNGAAAYPTYQQLDLTAGVTGLLPNANLANTATTVNGQTCTLGSTCTVPFQTNGTPNTSQAGINLLTSTANSVGLTVTPTNSATNAEKFEVTGSFYTGNAATATALAATPSQCSGANPIATGIAANGNANCTTATGITLQTNTVNNSSQTTLNLLNSSTNTAGLAATVTNTSAGNVQVEIPSGTLKTGFGGTGVASPTAHTVPVAEGATAMTFLSPSTSGYVLTSNGTSADPSFQLNPSNNFSGGTQYGLAYATGATTLTSIAPPTTNGLWNMVYNITGSAAVAPSVVLAGLTGRAITGAATTDTVLYSDSLTVVDHDAAASGAVNQTLPTATSLGNAAFGYSYSNHSAQTDTITPTTWTINGSATLSVPTGNFCRIKVDPNSATNWLADCAASSLTAGVSSWSGDGALFTNSLSTGAVTGTLGTAGAYNIWMNNTGSTATPGYHALPVAALPTAIPIGNIGSAGLSGSSPIAISSAGAISCATCATGPGSSTANDVAAWSGTGGLPLLDTNILYTNLVTAAANYTNGNLVQAAGANKTTSDSGIATANVVTAASDYTSGNLVQAAGANKTTSDSGIATGNVVTAASAAGAANQVAISSAASKAIGYVAADTTTTHALFATATAPAFRSIASTDLPLSAMGTITGGTWNGTAVGATYGGTGIDSHTLTGVAHLSSGTWSASAVVGSDMTNGTVTATQLAAQYSKGSCMEAWGGSGTSFALTSGDDAISNNTCYNDSGVTRTITAVKCFSDNGTNTTTVNPTFGASGTGTTILSAALTCGSSNAMSSSGTVSNGAWTTGTGINPAMGGTLTGTHIGMIVEFTF